MQKARESGKALLNRWTFLYSNNTDLNHRLHRLSGLEAMLEYGLMSVTGNYLAIATACSIRSLLAVLISLLTVLLYLIIHRDLNRIKPVSALKPPSTTVPRSSYNPENAWMLHRRSATFVRHWLPIRQRCAELLLGEEKKSCKDEYAGKR